MANWSEYRNSNFKGVNGCVSGMKVSERYAQSDRAAISAYFMEGHGVGRHNSVPTRQIRARGKEK